MREAGLRNHLAVLFAWFGLSALVLFASPLPAAIGADEPPKPAQKDSSTRAKPKDVALTSSVKPVEAKPGDTVTFEVTAKLKPGWHIYTQAKSQEGDGPRKTLFDLFDTGGLEVVGDWKASKKPESKAEPAFDNKVFEYFEEDVTWSITLKIPPGTPAGKKTIRCQASYQICNAQSCSFPGRWTLPDATVTVTAGDEASAAAPPTPALSVSQVKTEAKDAAIASTGSPPAPSRKDSSARIRPKGVTLTPSAAPATIHAGESLEYKVTAKLETGLHIYAVGKEDEGKPGPIPTTFDFFDHVDFKITGDWKPDRQPESRPEPAFDNQIIQFFENEVTWSITLSAPTSAAPGPRTLRCQAGYQICTERSCFPPGQWTLPDVTVTVLASSAQAASQDGTQAAKSVAAAVGSSPDAPQPPKTTEPAPASSPASSVTPGETKTAAAVTAIAPASTSKAPVSEIAQRAQQGLIPFLLASALGGLFALVMPCVWPMIPITVNFFVKQGQAGKGDGKTTSLAITYCLAIIGIFTGVGVFFSFFFSASFLQNLANNPWLNLVVAGLFLAFGLSLLGLFEIRLPNFLLNASSRGESRGGLIGVFFMALTLTITSFTCTFPVVGGLLVMAAGGNFLYPIIGLATFASVLAFPFLLLALSPGLLARMPRSGDWMNSVKVVGGLVEIGAAFKFLNTAELGYVTPENAWFDASVVLTSWIALSAVCGFYLLGFFRTDHDYDEVKVGPGRMIFGTLFLGLALYMLPALFGRPPQSLVWDRLIVGILPPDASEFNPPIAVAGTSGEAGATGPSETRASSPDPSEAQRQEKKAHGVLWGMSLEQARELAAKEKRPILIDFTGVNCANCRLMERRVLPRPEVVNLLKQFVTVQLYTDFVPIASITAAQRRELAEHNQETQLDLAQEATNPFYVVLTPDGKEPVASVGGYNEPPVFLDFLTKALGKARGGMKVAQAAPAK